MIAEQKSSAIAEESPGVFFDLERYPIDKPNDPVRANLVKSCRQQLAETGCARLPAFINSEALVAMTGEVVERLSQVDKTADWQNPYLSEDDETLPDEHPVRQFHYRKNAFLCRDRFAEGDWVDRLFSRMELLNFVRDCLGLKQLYHYADPMSGYLINIQEGGETFPWHFDTNEFTISLMLQQSTGGGVFEYAPAIRNAESENYDAVAAVMEGGEKDVIALPLNPGDLQIFKGRYALHRVTPVEGQRSRYMAIFGYTESPNVISKASRKLKLFGRCLDSHLEAETLEVTRLDNLRD
ncbi:MAG: hypothetical protein MJK10_01440 [Pseudomonadales bacterium]|nr:hypothetical protein [Pseudomonadales bacterium]NRA14535.1 hypothetical protein [Oceanospirillaceae bacterium]